MELERSKTRVGLVWVQSPASGAPGPAAAARVRLRREHRRQLRAAGSVQDVTLALRDVTPNC